MPVQTVWFNGEIVPYGSLTAAAFDRAWRYADGGFETIFFDGETAPLYELHRRRAQTHARLSGVEAVFPSKPEFEDILRQLAHTHPVKEAAWRCRLTWFRGGGGFYLPQDTEGRVLAELFPFDPQAVPRKQFAVFYDEQPLAFGKLSPFKKIGAHIYTDAARFARQHGVDDCILLGAGGHVAETVSCNLVMRRGDVFSAPRPEDGGVEGVALTYLSERLPQLGFTFERRSHTPAMLMEADEILTVNALRGISCIILLDGKPFPAKSLELNKHLPLGSYT